MSLLLKSGDSYFEVSETDLAACEIEPQEFGAAGVADRNLAATAAFDPWEPAKNASSCADYSGYGASCSKAPNCP
jgi:hypothetical protein